MLLTLVMYLIYVSLGLPDSLLGSGWPVMQKELGVPSSYAGYVFMTISFMTIISALLSPALIKRVHTKWIIIISIILTTSGVFGFSLAAHFTTLIILAIPYGLGAGAVDAAVNHYVANNFSGAVMNYLHCFYGVGAVVSPNIMAFALKESTWHEGYRYTSYLLLGILIICIVSLPLWKKSPADKDDQELSASITETICVPGVIFTLVSFFAYCSGEATCFVWTSSYFADTHPELGKELVASFGSLVFFGLMLGRLSAGLITKKLGDRNLIRYGILLELLGILLVALPGTHYVIAAAGFLMIGTGMGPVFPGIQHMAPINFDKRFSAAVIGLQMASAYIGSTFMPMIFGQIQLKAGMVVMPVYLLIFAIMNISFLEITYVSVRKSADGS